MEKHINSLITKQNGMKMIDEAKMTWLSGYKTHIAAALIILAAIAKGKGWIDSGTYEVVLGILGGLGISFLRSGVSKRG